MNCAVCNKEIDKDNVFVMELSSGIIRGDKYILNPTIPPVLLFFHKNCWVKTFEVIENYAKNVNNKEKKEKWFKIEVK